MQKHIKEKAAVLFMSDSLAIFPSFLLAILIGHKKPFTLDLLLYYPWGFATLFLSTILLFFLFDAYSLNKFPQRFTQQALILGFGLLASSVLTTFLFFFSRDTVPRAVFILFYAIAFCLITFFRYLINKQAISSINWRVVLVGDVEKCVEVAQVIQSRAYLHTVVAGYVPLGAESAAQHKLPLLGNITNLISIAENNTINQIIVAASSLGDDLVKLLRKCMQKKIRVSDFRNVLEEITGKVPIDHLNDNWFILELSTSDERYFWCAKRLFDIVLSCVGLCMILPLLPIVALLIKLDSSGPTFYFQDRIGRRNKPFRVWKLRTMVTDADKNNIHWTTNDDDRITKIGKIIRKMRLDEVPQLINILKGEMSLIGPRPEAVSLVKKYTKAIPFYTERHLVTPGITGWAQINYRYGNSIEDTRQKLMYDFYYIKNRCLLLDLVIFLRTIRIVLTGKGAL